ncbi:MAG: hypothetical protein AB7Q42_18615 [Acidimicrobiia bacterium]
MSPRHPDFAATVLRPLAARFFAGEAQRDLAVELYETVHLWASGQARAQCAGLPAHADRGEVVSQVLRLAWESCLRIDWTRYESWPALLERKVAHARIEAARSEDWLSRRERVYRRRFQREIALREQQCRRPLTAAEREDAAVAVAPSSSRVDWAKALLAARHPSTVGDVPETIDGIDLDEEVELRVLSEIRARRLHEWLAVLAEHDQRLADDLRQWGAGGESPERTLPSRLARRVEPYAALLLGMLSEAV